MLTGKPGIGKTTLIRQISEELKNLGRHVQGFFTQEVRESGVRIGFDVIFLDGAKPCPLARIDSTAYGNRLPKVGRYSVMTHEFDLIAVASLKVRSPDGQMCYMFVDEIGKMELFSSRFKQVVSRLLECDNVIVVGTVPSMTASTPAFVKSVHSNKQVHVVEITHQNRNDILKDLMSYLV